MNTHFEAYVTKEVASNNCKTGIGKYTLMLSNEKAGCGTTLTDCMKAALDFIGYEGNNLENAKEFLKRFFIEDCSCVVISRTENNDFQTPSKEEIADWKEGKIDLWSAAYTIEIKKITIENITKSDIIL